MNIKDVIDYLESKYPLTQQEDWDHSGLQLGDVNQKVTTVMITLNVDQATIQQAIEQHCQLIISHYPFFFHTFNTIDLKTIFGQNIFQLMSNHMTVYSLHTNYDALRMNTLLLELLGCHHIEMVEPSGVVRSGILPTEMSFQGFINHLKKTFHLSRIRYCGSIPETVSKIAICGGSGHDYIVDALQKTNVYITGDLTYSHAMDVILQEQGVVIEIPHFVEAAFKYDIHCLLSEIEDLQIVTSQEKDYFTYIE